MILIAHRGNINGRQLKMENNPTYLLEALNKGYQVETDVWYDNGWWLGHDEPKYKCNRKDLRAYWCHAKNIESLYKLREKNIHCFWHDKDDVTLTSSGWIWTHPTKKLTKKSICVMPEYSNYKNTELKNCAGICSDYIGKYA